MIAGIEVGTVLQILTTIAIAAAGWFAKVLRDSVNELQTEVEKNRELAKENAKARQALTGVDLNGGGTEGLLDQIDEVVRQRKKRTTEIRQALQHIKERIDVIEREMLRAESLETDLGDETTNWPWEGHYHPFNERYYTDTDNQDSVEE